MLNNILINKLNNRDVILNNPRPKTSIGTKKWCRKRGKALNNKHPALNNRLNNILNNTATGLFNALNNKLINRAPRLFNMEELQGFVAGKGLPTQRMPARHTPPKEWESHTPLRGCLLRRREVPNTTRYTTRPKPNQRPWKPSKIR